MRTNHTDEMFVRMEVARRAKMTPTQVADEIEKLLVILLPTEKPHASKAKAYAEAWVDAGYVILQHGVLIVDALRQSPSPRKATGDSE